MWFYVDLMFGVKACILRPYGESRDKEEGSLQFRQHQAAKLTSSGIACCALFSREVISLHIILYYISSLIFC